MPLTIGLIYDCKEDYLAAGSLPEDVLEFDPEETIAGLAAVRGLIAGCNDHLAVFHQHQIIISDDPDCQAGFDHLNLASTGSNGVLHGNHTGWRTPE